MKPKIVITALLFVICFKLFAQKEERNANYHFKAENYFVALNLYDKLYKQDTLNEISIYRLAECLIKCKTTPELAIQLLTRLDSVKSTEPEYHYNLGMAYHYNMQFSKAIQAFNKCTELANKDLVLQNTANMWKAYSGKAKNMVKNPLDVSFVNMGKYINTKMEETTPFVSSSGEMLFFTSNNKYDSKYMLYSSNVYYATLKNGVFAKSKALSVVNSMDDEFVAGISLQDDKLFVQLQGFEAYQDLVYSQRVGKGYRGKNILNENVNSRAGEFAACETSGGDTLYFSSTRQEGQGGTDIYFSLKLPDGNWGLPRNLGEVINTPYDEDFPVISADGSKIYFCSNNPNSMGGFDIFVSKINSETRGFSTPKNIGYPLNDVYDNKTIAYSSDNRYAYVSAIRPDGIGNSDLYRVVFNQEDPSVKIYLLNMKKGTEEAKEPFATTDSTLNIKAYQKGKVIFGEYAYDAKNSQSTIALPPGFYTIEVKGAATEDYSFKVTIPDVPTDKRIVKKDILLKPKN